MNDEGEKLILIRDELLHVKRMYSVLLKDNLYVDLYKTLTGYYDVETAIYRIEERMLRFGLIKPTAEIELDGLKALAEREQNK